jgi:hypothetical protein
MVEFAVSAESNYSSFYGPIGLSVVNFYFFTEVLAWQQKADNIASGS